MSQDTITLIRLGHLLTWLRDSIPVNKHSSGQGSIKPVSVRLEQALASLLVMEDMELVLVFALVCRALGLNTRLVINFNLPSKADSNKPAASVDTKTAKSDKSRIKTDESKSRKRSKSSDSESEDDEKKTKHSKSKRRSKSAAGNKNMSEEKPSISSKLAAAVSKRKSKTLAPSVTEETIIKGIKESPSKETKRSRSSRSKSTKIDVDEEKASTSKASCSKSKSSSKSSNQNESKSTKVVSKLKTETTSDSTYKQTYWVEVFLNKEKKWIPVDVLSGRINNTSDIESRLAKPVMYVLAVNMKGLVKDVTRRYSSNYLTQARKQRVDENWFGETLRPWLDRDNKKEDNELIKKSEEGPLPTSVSAFKGHPLYALQRHLLKFEAIYPVEAPTLGFIKGEPVYARECVHTLLGRTAWLKEGKVVRIGEEPYKVVKARPKWDRMSGTKKADEPLELVIKLWLQNNFNFGVTVWVLAD